MNPTVRVGQIWQDNDPRSYGRKLRVLEVGDTHALVELHQPRRDTNAKRGRQTRIRLDRFKPTSTGYRLIQDATT
ncbi:hypothetical protein ABH931_006118 [Streptacidiphilus sp. MAP12-33]|uniref:DUF6354 family protein n=1 Tax=Streptacidiphilus sp. MAP12-33 TaxID=3156266 RepID=UPI0035169BC0